MERLSAQKMRLVRNIFLFQGIDEMIVERIVSDGRCTVASFPRGGRIYDETHFRKSLGVILSGMVRVDKPTPEGRLLQMSTLSPGECFGAAAMFGERERYATILTAASPVEVLFLTEALIRWAMRRDFTITENYIRYLSGRIWYLNEKISSLAAGTIEQRIAGFLLEQGTDRAVSFASMTALARQLNVGRASLYRAMDAFQARGLIRREGKSVWITDQAGLARVMRGG